MFLARLGEGPGERTLWREHLLRLPAAFKPRSHLLCISERVTTCVARTRQHWHWCGGCGSPGTWQLAPLSFPSGRLRQESAWFHGGGSQGSTQFSGVLPSLPE